YNHDNTCHNFVEEISSVLKSSVTECPACHTRSALRPWTMWFTLLLCIFIVAILCTHLQKPKQFPPGPPRLPILGNLLTFQRLVKDTGHFYLAVSQLAAKYGRIVGIYLGSGPPTVFVSGYEEVQQALSNSDLDGRPDGFFNKLRTMGERRDFGFGKRSMEVIIQEEAQILVRHVETLATEHPDGVALHEALTLPVLNSLWAIVAGVRYELNDEIFKKYISIQDAQIRKLDASGGLEIVNYHKITLEQQYSRDLIDVYLHEIESNNYDKTFSESQLIAVLKDLFVAGSETTSNTLSFFFLYMLLYPDIQTRVQAEITNVVGTDKLPSLENRKDMPYLSAVLLEVQRIANIGPMTLPHRALADVEIGGYVIPKDSTVLMSLYSIHMNKEYWGDPEEFRPERFLNPDGVFTPNPRVLPFGSGHRRCLGDTLAKNSLFLFTTILLQTFFISPSPGKQSPSTRPRKGLTLKPESYNVVLTKRK
ncbi:Methyl farnesoate epoxidase, partial [Gryllus bimaculatus]